MNVRRMKLFFILFSICCLHQHIHFPKVLYIIHSYDLYQLTVCKLYLSLKHKCKSGPVAFLEWETLAYTLNISYL